MKIIYIRETQNTCDFIKILILRIKKIFNAIKIEKIKEGYVYYLPMFGNTNISKYRTKKICNKINKLIEKNDINTVVLSECLNNNCLFKNYLYSNNINILNGKYLFRCLTNNIIAYILKMQKKQWNTRRSNYFN